MKVYKDSNNKEGESEFLKSVENKVPNSWEINFALAYHPVHFDFIWPESAEFEKSANYLKKVIALNPKEFNSYLLLSVAYEKDKNEREYYLKKMYELNPEQFYKNNQENNKKLPYCIKSIKTYVLAQDLTVVLTTDECRMLKLIR
jgi:hypothetical protein